jgi:murein DD-endopeptidase MepM/ murein hydrolase activator NlpD
VNSAGWLIAVLALALLGAGVLVFFRAEGAPPVVAAPEALVVGTAGAEVALSISDEGSGLRGLEIVVVHAGGEIPLLSESYPGNLLSGGVRSQQDADVSLDPAGLGEVEGDAFLRVTARDWSWRGGLGGNATRVDVPLTVDLEPPRISVESGLTYVDQGGAAAVAYRVSEPVERDGVRVGEIFYRGYPRPAGGGPLERVALFAIPSDADPKAPVRVVAEDAAGNASEARWPVSVKARTAPAANVSLSADFLERVVPRLSGGASDAAAFDDVNTRLRAESESRIRELLSDPATTPLWDGALEQMRSSKVTSRFGERRSYFVDGVKISSATHYGYDLASFAAAPVTAAGAGRVVFAGDLGIYGNAVLIDHGIGLATLYGHLSRLDVKAGDRVTQGQRLGLSGDTGLAGGDHLHFAVLVGPTYVDPLEWWDPRWVQTHVAARLARPGA